MYELEDNHFWFLGKRIYANATIQPLASKIRKILDVGCGTGGLTKSLEKYGKVVGVEKNKYAAGLAKKRGLEVLGGNAQDLPFLDNEFDLVTLFDILYHREIGDERKVIKEAYRVLKPKGFLLLTDSALPFLKSGHDIAVYGKRRYFLSEITNLLKSQNFIILRASYIYFFLFLAFIIKRLLIDKIAPREEVDSDVKKMPDIVNSLLLKIIQLESALFKIGVSYPIGSSVIVLAQKK